MKKDLYKNFSSHPFDFTSLRDVALPPSPRLWRAGRANGINDPFVVSVVEPYERTTSKTTLLLLTLAALFSCVNAAELTLSLSHVDSVQQDGKAVPTVNLNESFVINVAAAGINQQTSRIDIDGINNFHMLGRQQSSSTHMINGVASSQTTLHITVQAKKEGTFTLGPATTEYDGKSISSNKLKLSVDAKYVSKRPKRGATKQDTSGASLLYKISTDKQQVVVGEPLILTTAIYAHGPILEAAVEQPSLSGFSIKPLKESKLYDETIDGIDYHVEEKKFLLVPQQEGKKIISPVKAQYAVSAQRKRRGGGFFDDDFINAFFGQQAEQRLATSNELIIDVLPLPKYQGNVDGVGTFSSFTATLNKQQAAAHEPIVLTLTIEGVGDLEHIAVPKLKLPASIKFYDSKNETNQDLTTPYANGKKRFEFVLQATQPGTCTIPEQAFTYFDTEKHKFKTVTTEPITLIITPAVGGSTNHISSINTAEPPQVNQSTEAPAQEQATDIHFIHEELVANKKHPASIPFAIFLVLLLTPTLLASRRISKIFGKASNRWHSKYGGHKARAQLDKQLEAIIRKNDACALYQFFLKFLAGQFKADVATVTEDWIEHQLRSAGWDQTKIHEFLDYLGTCAQFHFSPHHMTAAKSTELLKRAQYWHVMINK